LYISPTSAEKAPVSASVRHLKSSIAGCFGGCIRLYGFLLETIADSVVGQFDAVVASLSVTFQTKWSVNWQINPPLHKIDPQPLIQRTVDC
jgi:hypothetical protein